MNKEQESVYGMHLDGECNPIICPYCRDDESDWDMMEEEEYFDGVCEELS